MSCCASRGSSKSFGRKPVLEGLRPHRRERARLRSSRPATARARRPWPASSWASSRPTAATSSIKGRRITYGQSAYKRDFGYVPEDPFFYEDMTVRATAGFQRPLLPEVGPEAGRRGPRALRPRPEGPRRDALAGPEAQAGAGRGPGRRPGIPHPRRPDLGPGRADAPGLPPGRHPRAGRFGHDRPLRHATSSTSSSASSSGCSSCSGGRLILDEDFDKVKATHQASLEDIFCRLVAGA